MNKKLTNIRNIYINGELNKEAFLTSYGEGVIKTQYALDGILPIPSKNITLKSYYRPNPNEMTLDTFFDAYINWENIDEEY